MAGDTAQGTRSRFRKVWCRMYADEKFRRLSPPPPSGQWLWVYLLTCPQTIIVPGIILCGEAALAEALGWKLVTFRKVFKELVREGLAKADWAARIVWVPNSIRYNQPDNPNVVKGWRTAWEEVPECDLKNEIRAHLGSALCERETFRETFAETFGETLPVTLSKPPGKPPPNGMPNQEQEQEQEQEQDKEPPLPPEGVALGFAEFWNRYPKKVAKDKALAAWDKISPDEALAATMLSALEKQKRSRQWTKDAGEYIPHPTTWLNQRRWENECEVTEASGRAPSRLIQKANALRAQEQQCQPQPTTSNGPNGTAPSSP